MPGSWREARTATRYTDHLFTDILIPLSGDLESWDSLEQAIIVAQHEGAKLHGLHIVDSKEKIDSPHALMVQTQFDQACLDAGVEGKLAIESGEITRKICERATMTDLIVLKLVHPPLGGISTLRSPFRAILVNSSRPVLGVPTKATQFRRALLAYDGSDRAREALFVATYLAEIWKTQLIIFTALDGTKVKADAQDYVRRYLDLHEVEADFLIGEHGAMDDLKSTVEDRDVELVLMGTHGGSTLRQVLVDSPLDYMLRETKTPIFICR
jgi:nucleotide-binding universal stress UspA family protein